MISTLSSAKRCANHSSGILESLGKERLVGVGERPPGKVPRLSNGNFASLRRHPHQLCDRHRRMRVVELVAAFGQLALQSRAAAGSAERDRASEQATRKSHERAPVPVTARRMFGMRTRVSDSADSAPRVTREVAVLISAEVE